jgi:TatA/E family protein of Tat protein translocase
MGPIGIQEMIGLFVIALLLFGPKKLPELGRMLAKGLTEFRRAKNELKNTFETHLHELEKETRLEQPSYTPPPSIQSSQSYPYSYDEYGHSNHEDTPVAPAEIAAPESSHLLSAPTPVAPVSDASVSSPVAGTVPRTNGVAPAHSVPAASKEEHPV